MLSTPLYAATKVQFKCNLGMSSFLVGRSGYLFLQDSRKHFVCLNDFFIPLLFILEMVKALFVNNAKYTIICSKKAQFKCNLGMPSFLVGRSGYLFLPDSKKLSVRLNNFFVPYMQCYFSLQTIASSVLQ